MNNKPTINIIGAGLAGSEATWQAYKRGCKIRLFEMRPKKTTPAHKTPYFSELVCSNSFKSNSLDNACGLLKEEMYHFDSLILKAAKETAVPAGNALSVDRERFSKYVTDFLRSFADIKIITEEVVSLDDFANEIVIIATGPLTSESFFSNLKKLFNNNFLYFYDAASPIVYYDSIDLDDVYIASRYNKGGADYINCPMDKEQYDRFYIHLVQGKTASLKDFEKEIYFEGCMPIEVLAKRGYNTLRYGTFKPKGLVNPKTNREPYAALQLRKDNSIGSLYNLVGCQTNLLWSEQQRIFRLIPGLANVEFAKFGVIHRNTFINSPKLLTSFLQLKKHGKIFMAGQIIGVEGYVESAASGMVAGINAARMAYNKTLVEFPYNTILGSLLRYITDGHITDFQPMNANFGIVPSVLEKIRNKKEKHYFYSDRSLKELKEFKV